MKRKRTKVLVAVALISSLFLMFLYNSMRVEEVRTQRTLTTLTTDNSSTLNKDVTLTTSPSPLLIATPEAQSESEQVVVSESFRNAIQQSSSYWNRKQHLLLRQLDSKDPQARIKYKKLDWSKCNALSMESLATNIQDFNSYPALYQDFLRGMECHDPPLLIDQPNKCSLKTGNGVTFLLFAIKSTPTNFERRQAVRETWGQEKMYDGGLRVRTVFLLGTSSVDDPSVDKLLNFEAKYYQDILQWDFRDSFYNLTLKENVFLQWMRIRCPKVMFVFKGDDDVFANTQGMLNYLRSLDAKKAQTLYAGHVVSEASPFRDAKSKYYVPHSFYEGAYPRYAGGGGFLFSGSLIRPLYRVSKYIAFFPIDDVYTGMCFQALGITPEAHKSFQTFDIREEDRENACVHKDLLLVHQRSPQQVLRLWRHMHSPLLTC